MKMIKLSSCCVRLLSGCSVASLVALALGEQRTLADLATVQATCYETVACPAFVPGVGCPAGPAIACARVQSANPCLCKTTSTVQGYWGNGQPRLVPAGCNCAG